MYLQILPTARTLRAPCSLRRSNALWGVLARLSVFRWSCFVFVSVSVFWHLGMICGGGEWRMGLCCCPKCCDCRGPKSQEPGAGQRKRAVCGRYGPWRGYLWYLASLKATAHTGRSRL